MSTISPADRQFMLEIMPPIEEVRRKLLLAHLSDPHKTQLISIGFLTAYTEIAMVLGGKKHTAKQLYTIADALIAPE